MISVIVSPTPVSRGKFRVTLFSPGRPGLGMMPASQQRDDLADWTKIGPAPHQPKTWFTTFNDDETIKHANKTEIKAFLVILW